MLLAVADAGSMAKAATRLAISQPAISRAIADAELTLGVPLFDRNPSGVEPTQYGRALLRRGVAAFDEIAQGVKDIAFLADPAAGELRIGSGPGLAEGLVLAAIKRLSRQYPRIVIHVVSGGLLIQHEALRERRIEFGFARDIGPVPEGDIDAEVLYEEPLAVVAGVNNPWARRRKIKLAELVSEPWTWPAAETIIDSLVAEAFRSVGVDPPRAMVYADPYSMRIRLAATGPFLAVVPTTIMRFGNIPASVKLLPVDLPTTHRPIGIITLKNRTLSPLAQLFIDCARKIAKPLANGR
jgi:DNA-binding transcriptional LysR family regulator